ncbi:septum formation family protein [Arthrobacter castelli]|uniref:septum formation family protein n=1 Tax=Arthrobacter castelli TaxID=271431 RepID=UPI000421FF42|nr:septum formation family protein [Arthrobacter castelli]
MSEHDGQPPENDAARRADHPSPDAGDSARDNEDTDHHQLAPGWFNTADPPDPQQRPQPRRSRKKASKAPLFLGIGVAAALIVGIILIATMLTGNGTTEADSKPDGNGVIAEDVSPFDFEQGQCFTDFTDATEPATVVTCETPHQAQLVNTFHYEDDADFPGEEALAQKAEELCRSTGMNAEANNYGDRLRQQTAYPQAESWQQGDRRVDCFIRITSGEITGSLID